MNKKDKPGSSDVPGGLDNLDDIERPSSTPGSPDARRGGLGGKETLRRLLDDDVLALTEDDAKGTVRRIQPNPGGLKKGYDPYDSGMLLKKQWKKKKDLRALSKWIEQKKKLDGED
jgi:hypothetical protein